MFINTHNICTSLSISAVIPTLLTFVISFPWSWLFSCAFSRQLGCITKPGPTERMLSWLCTRSCRITHHPQGKGQNVIRDAVFQVQMIPLNKVSTVSHFLKRELSWWESPNYLNRNCSKAALLMKLLWICSHMFVSIQRHYLTFTLLNFKVVSRVALYRKLLF